MVGGWDGYVGSTSLGHETAVVMGCQWGSEILIPAVSSLSRCCNIGIEEHDSKSTILGFFRTKAFQLLICNRILTLQPPPTGAAKVLATIKGAWQTRQTEDFGGDKEVSQL